MIITRAESKAFLKITDNDNDSFIDLNLPIIEQIICNYCNTDFIDMNFDYFVSTTITFNSDDNSINMTNIENKKLVVNDSIRVYNSLRNNQTFTIDSISTDKIIVNNIDTIIEENESESTYITRLNYPKPLKLTASKMLNFLLADLDEDKTPGAKSEKIDDYSVTYEDNYEGFPLSIMKALNSYRYLYKIDLFNCHRRGF
jgi:hypothetical protein